MKKIAAQMALIIGIVGISMYLGDYTIFRYRVAAGRSPYGTVTVRYYYAIQEKNGKTEYDFQPPQQETCANTIFPHSGHRPCWYERKHAEKPISI
jgi:hypothetical protein